MAYEAANKLRQAGMNYAVQSIKTAAYTPGSAQAVTVINEYSDRLKTGQGKRENNVMLHIGGDYEIEFIDARISVVKSMDVKSTSLVNRAGAVKELIQEKDYGVTISGNLHGEQDKFPYNELALLNYILSHAGIIDVASAYLCIFDIEKLAFKSANFNQGQATYFNIMPFSLTFESDMEYDFLIND
jgi:hypothetical protein